MDGYITSVSAPDLVASSKPDNVVDIVVTSLWTIRERLLEPIKLMTARTVVLVKHYDLLVINELYA